MINESGFEIRDEVTKKMDYSENEIIEQIQKCDSCHEQFKEELFHILVKNRSVFSDQPGRLQIYEHEIWLNEGQTYVFQVLPFGLSTSVSSFIRGFNKILGSDVAYFLIPYVDDLLIFFFK